MKPIPFPRSAPPRAPHGHTLPPVSRRAPRWLWIPFVLFATLLLTAASCTERQVQTPTSLRAEAGDGSVVLTWSSVELSHRVYLASEPGVTRSSYRDLADGRRIEGAVSPFTVTGLRNGTSYHFVVTGFDSAAAPMESAESAEVSATPVAVGGAFAPTTDTTLPAGDHVFSDVDIPDGVTVTVAGDAAVTVRGDARVAGALIVEGRALLTVGGELSVDGSLVAERGAPPANEPDPGPGTRLEDLPAGLFVIAAGGGGFGAAADVRADGPIVVTDSAEQLRRTLADVRAEVASADGDLPTLVPLPPADPAFAGPAPRARLEAQQADVVVVVSGNWDVSGLPGDSAIVLLRFTGAADLVLRDLRVAGPPAPAGEGDDASAGTDREGQEARGEDGGRGLDLNVRTDRGEIAVDTVTLLLTDGGPGGAAAAYCNAATGGDGGEAGSFRMSAGGGIRIAGALQIVPGRGGDGGAAISTGDGACDVIATGGAGATEQKRLYARGNVTGLANVRVAEVRGGDGGPAIATTAGNAPDGDACGEDGSDGGDASASGGAGGRASVAAGGAAAAATLDGARGGDGGDADADAGYGGAGGDCTDGRSGGAGGAGGAAQADGGDGGTASGGVATRGDGGAATVLGGDGGRGGDACGARHGPGGTGGDGGDAAADGGAGDVRGASAGAAGDGGRGGNGLRGGAGGAGGTGTGAPADLPDGADGADGELCPLQGEPHRIDSSSLPQGTVAAGDYALPLLDAEGAPTGATITLTVRSDGAPVIVEGDLIYVSAGGGFEFNFDDVPGRVVSFRQTLDLESCPDGGPVQTRGLVAFEDVVTHVADTEAGVDVTQVDFAEGFDDVYLESLDGPMCLRFGSTELGVALNE